MKLPRIVLIPLALMAISAMAQTTAPPPVQDTAVSIKRVPKVGDELRYKIDTTIYGETDTSYTSTTVWKITKVDTNGDYTSVEKVLAAKIKIGDIEQTLPESTQTAVYSAFNSLVDVTGDDVDDTTKPYLFRLHALQWLVVPDKAVKPGDTWTIEYKADANHGNVASTVDYTVDAQEKVGKYDCLRIKALSKQVAPGESTGDLMFWVNIADGTLVKATAVLKKAVFAKVDTPLDVSFTLTRDDSASSQG